MTDSITPPPELVQQWLGEFFGCTVSGELSHSERFLATRAAQWGADMELQACCHYFARDLRESLALELRASRRPKPPSLKEQALKELQMAYDTSDISMVHLDTIRRALEQIDD